MIHTLPEPADVRAPAPASSPPRPALAKPPADLPANRWLIRAAAAALAAAFAWSYWTDLADMARQWSHDPRYSHGFLVPLFAAFLWWRRGRNHEVSFRPSWWGAGILGVAALLRLTAAYVYLDWLDKLSLLPALAGLAVLLGGWPAWHRGWPAVAFLAFMLPLPYQLEIGLAHPLQAWATAASTYALQTLGAPAIAEGNVIVMDDVRIGVVEACSGLGMLVTFFALATAVVILIRRPLRDKVVLFASAAPIAVAANLARITLTGVLHRTAGGEAANLFYHDLAGWLMMPFALGLLGLEAVLLARLFIPLEPVGLLPLPLPVFSPLSPRPSASGLARGDTAGGEGSGVRGECG